MKLLKLGIGLNLGFCLLFSPYHLLAVNLVANGDFETGTFASWSTSGNFQYCSLSSGYAHGGVYGAKLGPGGTAGYLSQTLATTAGASYSLSCWLNSDGNTPNEFIVSWGGSVIFDGVNLPAVGWTNLQFNVTATAASTVLQFGFRDDPSYLGLDDISVAPGGAPTTVVFTATPTSGPAPLPVQFGCQPYDGVGNSITRWNWSFGDGATSTEPNPYHVYANPGLFTPTLTVMNSLGTNLAGVGPAISAGFWSLHNFAAVTNASAYPVTPLTPGANGMLYGATYGSGQENGSVFAIHSGGTLFTVLRSFMGTADGARPNGGMVVAGDTLFGTTSSGGAGGGGTVFRLNTDGSGFTNIYSFSGKDGSSPVGTLVLSGNTLYGATASGGTYGYGTVFKLNTNGAGFTTVFHSTNTVGYMAAGLVLAGNTLYGTANDFWGSTYGSVFKVDTDGTGFAILHAFTDFDGAHPNGGLTLAGDTLYGTTFWSAYVYGGLGRGEIFKLQTNGTAFSILHNFRTNEASYPYGELVLSSNVLYGIGNSGGDANQGTVFKFDLQSSAVTVLRSFSTADGASPQAGLSMAGGALYGTTEYGGAGGDGTVFKMSTDGSAFSTLCDFNYLDGRNAYDGLLAAGTTLYGTTYSGGAATNGALFQIKADGSCYRVIHSFTNAAWASPNADLALGDNALYGTTAGTVFRVNTDATGYTNLHTFAGSDGNSAGAGLVLSGSTLYGVTYTGGTGSYGTLFALSTDGTGFSVLHSFGYWDGGHPNAVLALSGNTLYGTTDAGGSGQNGTVFKIGTDGYLFGTLYNFSGSDGSVGPVLVAGNTLYGATYNTGNGYGVVFKLGTGGSGFTALHTFNSTDGAYPRGKLVLVGGTLYGTTARGGEGDHGTVFKVNTDGTGFAPLGSFSSPGSGNYPCSGLVLVGNTLFGSTANGATQDNGNLFAVSLPTFGIALNIQRTGGNVIVTWADPSFYLEAAPALNGTFTNIPGALSPYSEPVTGGKKFFRLFHP